MAQAATTWVGKPVWVDLASGQPDASRDFYGKLFGWKVEVSPDPQYGGYATAMVGDSGVAGIGPKMMAEAPTAWSLYIGTDDIDETTRKAQAAGGQVIAPPLEVGDQGKMAVYQDPIGAFIAAWQPTQMAGFESGKANEFGWGELNARGIERALPFYRAVFGWDTKSTPMGEGQPPYTEFLVNGESIAGGMDLPPNASPQVPSHWLVYFNVSDVDAADKKAVELGAKEIVSPMDFAGGRFAEVLDPEGAPFGILKMSPE